MIMISSYQLTINLSRHAFNSQVLRDLHSRHCHTLINRIFDTLQPVGEVGSS